MKLKVKQDVKDEINAIKSFPSPRVRFVGYDESGKCVITGTKVTEGEAVIRDGLKFEEGMVYEPPENVMNELYLRMQAEGIDEDVMSALFDILSENYVIFRK
jgi:hypothetical protein